MSRITVPRVGGQALADGVLMRAGDVWAVARRDGSLEVGRLPATKWAGVPVLRVVTGLGPALVRGLRAMGGRGREVPPRVRYALPLFLLGPLALNFALSRLFGIGAVWGWASGSGAVALVLLQLVALRLLMPGSMWRYHGAEHKAVAAYERGVDLDDLDAVLRAPRIHDRCGTNVVAVLVLACLLPLPSSGAFGFLVFVTVFALAVETVSLAARRPRLWLSRVVLSGGHLLQRLVTTAEPTREEQAVGVKALQACLAMLAADRVASSALLVENAA